MGGPDAAAVALPLAGGRDGAAVRVHPLHAGSILAPPGFIERPRGRLGLVRGLALHKRPQWTPVPVPAFAVEHPGAGTILIDTGLHADVAHGARAQFGALLAFATPPVMKPEWAVPARLEALGIDPGGVGLVLMTHLHADHASGIAQFPRATFLVDDREWTSAVRTGYRGGYRRALFDHPFDWRTLSFEGPAAQRYATFLQTLDVFGDGSVRLLSTRGHTAGHFSVLLRLGGGRELLLTADAAYALRTIRERLVPLLCPDEQAYLRSLDQIRRYVEETPDAVVICGHDAREWPGVSALYT